MKKTIVFGSEHWPGCEPAKEYLSEKNIEFDYIDITESMANLKIFLRYRDSYDEFKGVKETGSVGIPCVVINDGEEIIFNYKKVEI